MQLLFASEQPNLEPLRLRPATFVLQKSLCSSLSVLLSIFLSSSVSEALHFLRLVLYISFVETVHPYLKQTTFFRNQVSLLNCSRQRIARSSTQTLHLGKGSGYVVNYYRHSVLRRLCNTWHLPSGGCHAFSWTYM